MTAASVRAASGERGRALAVLVVAAVLWGASLPAGKLALREIGPTWLIADRFALACLAFAPLVAWRSLRLTRTVALQVLVGGVLAALVVFVLQFEGLSRTTATSAALIVATAAPLLAVFAAVVDREVPSRLAWVAVALSVLGVALMAGRPGPGRTLLGDAMCLGAMTGTAAWVLLMRRIAWAIGPVEAAALQFAVGLVLLVPLGFWREGPHPALSASGWAAVAFLGVVCTAVTFALWNWGVMRVEAARAGVIANLEPLVGTALGVAVLGEHVTPLTLVGGATLVAAALLASRSPAAA